MVRRRGAATVAAMRRALVLALPLAAACSSTDAPPVGPDPRTESLGMAACTNPGDGRRCVTHRGIAGISMGGGAAMRIGLEHPELFDVVGSLGSPYLDLEYFFNSVSGASAGGFCPREQLLAHLDALDTKDDPNTWCGPVAFGDLALEGTTCGGFSGDFNHHYRGTDAGRGGSFNREGSFEVVFDLALAFGNPAFYNPASPYLPPGVGLDHHVPLALSAPERGAERVEERRRICGSPVVQRGFHDRVYNPTGEHPVITFCDGNGAVNGEYEPGVARLPFEVALAVDYNSNGRRDYAEPVLSQPIEPLDDLGPDHLASAEEPGYDPVTNPDPAGDDYDWLTNPLGPENNHVYDAGEVYQDHGLDGVAGTGDFGEGNGKHDVNPNLARAFERSPKRLLERIDAAALDRLDLWADAGIRDFLYSAQITNHFFGALNARGLPLSRYTDWAGLHAATGAVGDEYDPQLADLSRAAIGQRAYLRYGDPSVCPDIDWETGRGNHVGPAWEVLNRLSTMLAFASARFVGGDFAVLRGELSEQGGPTGGIEDFVQVQRFDSAALGRAQPYVVILPPDYYAQPNGRWPVLYFLHGQGQKATDLAASALLFLSPMMSSERGLGRSDWQKMIIVFADGECQPGECHTGTFYIDFQGVDGAGPKHGEAFFELMRTVEQRYRTKAAEVVAAP